VAPLFCSKCAVHRHTIDYRQFAAGSINVKTLITVLL